MRLPSSKLLHSLYSRVTFNRTTVAFFILSFIHCFAQGILQSFLFSIDTSYNSILSSITTRAGIPANNITYLEGSPGNWHLRICDHIPSGQQPSPCIDIFRSAVDTQNPLTSDRQAVLDDDNLIIEKAANATGVVISSGSHSVFLNLQCTQTLAYSENLMHNAKREDLTFVLLQFWLLGISIFAIMTDSVPHTLAVLITRLIITAWAAYAVWRTNFYHTQFTDIIFKPGTPCSINLYPEYFQLRVAYEIPDLILNVTALFIACYLSFKLLRDYSTQSFRCVGAPKHINRIHKFFMAVLVCLQLECFVVLAAGGLWIDVLVNTAIANISSHSLIYKGLFIITAILLLPWIAMGWYAIRGERRTLMIVFLGVSFFFLTCWLSMFDSMVYRWSFLQWPYLGCFTIASLTLIVASIVLGVICRLNFGKGFAQYLHAEAALESSNFAPEVFKHDEEKYSLELEIKVPETR